MPTQKLDDPRELDELVRLNALALQVAARDLVREIRKRLPVVGETWRTEKAFKERPGEVMQAILPPCRDVEKLLQELVPIAEWVKEHSTSLESLGNLVQDISLTFGNIRSHFNLAVPAPAVAPRAFPQRNVTPIPPSRLTTFLCSVCETIRVSKRCLPNPLLTEHLDSLEAEISVIQANRDEEKPYWDRARRVLWYRGQQCKRSIRSDAVHVISILDGFSNQAWKPLIDNPLLSDDEGSVSPELLTNALKNLKKGLSYLRFRAANGGDSITWEPAVSI
jgi:hypothetical protein